MCGACCKWPCCWATAELAGRRAPPYWCWRWRWAPAATLQQGPGGELLPKAAVHTLSALAKPLNSIVSDVAVHKLRLGANVLVALVMRLGGQPLPLLCRPLCRAQHGAQSRRTSDSMPLLKTFAAAAAMFSACSTRDPQAKALPHQVV